MAHTAEGKFVVQESCVSSSDPSQTDTRLMKTDLDQLKAFIKSDLLSAVVKREAEAAVHRVENILSHEEKEEAAGPGIRRGSGSSIDLYYESGTGLHPLGRVSSDQPVSSLKSVLLVCYKCALHNCEFC